MSGLANHQFLELERVLDYNVMDVYAYLQYTDEKVKAENAQRKFIEERSKKR